MQFTYFNCVINKYSFNIEPNDVVTIKNCEISYIK